MKKCLRCEIEKEDGDYSPHRKVCKKCCNLLLKIRRIEYVENYQCVQCAKPIEAGNRATICFNCLKKARAGTAKLVANRQCRTCSEQIEDENKHTSCLKCLEIRKIRIVKLVANRQCCTCSEQIEEGNKTTRCFNCLKKKVATNAKLATNHQCYGCYQSIEIENKGVYCFNCLEKRRVRVIKLIESHKCKQCSRPIEIENKNTRCFICIESRNVNCKIKYKENINYKLRIIISSAILQILKNNNSSKKGKSCLKYLPFTIEELKNHLESHFDIWMTWENHGVYRINTWDDNDPSTWVWHIDHIIPCDALPYTSMEDENFKKCWALSNLRPLSAKENIKKGNKII